MTCCRSLRRLLVLGPVLIAGTPLGAQYASVLRTGVSPLRTSDSLSPIAAGRSANEPRTGTALDKLPLWSAPIASALVPGLGQARLRKDRFVGYMAVEGFLLLQYVKNTREGHANARSFRALARDVARRGFPGDRPDTVWKYYESMEKYIESGAFTLSLVGPTVPETDTLTFNGHEWLQARLQYGVPLGDPGPTSSPRYQAALALYEVNAIRQPYGWSWRNAQLEKDLYMKTIESSDEAYRRATKDLIAIIANHLLSAVDAFAIVRLIQAAGGEMRLSASIPTP